MNNTKKCWFLLTKSVQIMFIFPLISSPCHYGRRLFKRKKKKRFFLTFINLILSGIYQSHIRWKEIYLSSLCNTGICSYFLCILQLVIFCSWSITVWFMFCIGCLVGKLSAINSLIFVVVLYCSYSKIFPYIDSTLFQTKTFCSRALLTSRLHCCYCSSLMHQLHLFIVWEPKRTFSDARRKFMLKRKNKGPKLFFSLQLINLK